MKRRVQKYILTFVALFALVATQHLYGDEVSGSRFDVMDHLSSYYRDLSALSDEVTFTNSLDSLQRLDKRLKQLELRWGGVYAPNEEVIGTDESLIMVVVEWQTLLEELHDKMTYRKGLATARVQLAEVRADIVAQDSLYDGYVEQAISLSLVKKLAKPLEKLKGDEQVTFGRLESGYSAVKTLAEQYEELRSGVDSLDRLYVEIGRRSETVQAQEFKPFIARIKDYLMSLAAVAMILMFLNMAQAKYKQMKAESKRLAELKKMMGGDKEYPTI